MKIDLRAVWRSGFLGAVLRAVISMIGRFLPFLIDKNIMRPLGLLVPIFIGAHFVYYHTEQDILPSVVGGAVVGLMATVLGLFAAFSFTFSGLSLGVSPLISVGGAAVGGALGGLGMLYYRRYSARQSL